MSVSSHSIISYQPPVELRCDTASGIGIRQTLAAGDGKHDALGRLVDHPDATDTAKTGARIELASSVPYAIVMQVQPRFRLRRPVPRVHQPETERVQ